MKDIGVDPTQDIGGRIGLECFVCGKPVLDAVPIFWKGTEWFHPKLPIHKAHLDAYDTNEIAAEYHRRISDLAEVARTH